MRDSGLPSPLLTTKLMRPSPRVDVVQRERLTRRLQAVGKAQLTLLSAPAGAGKTTLLTTWEPPTPLAWLSLDAGDNDPARFLTYLITALQGACREVGQRALPLLKAQHPPLELAATILVNDLAALAQPVVLVLDDYHAVENPAVHHTVAFLLEHAPQQLHLVIATRTDPPLPLPRLRARGQLVELRMPDLRFDPSEAGVLLSSVSGLALADPEVAALQARTEGGLRGCSWLRSPFRAGRQPPGLPAPTRTWWTTCWRRSCRVSRPKSAWLGPDTERALLSGLQAAAELMASLDLKPPRHSLPPIR